MQEVLDPLFLFYFLVMPIVVGMGIDSKIKNRYPFGASCGVVFYLGCAIWNYMGLSGKLAMMEPVIALIFAGMGILFIGLIFEYKRPVSGFSRHAVVFLTVSSSGLPLYAILKIIRGEMGFVYPGSILPLFQFVLAVLGIVVLANIIEARLYSKNEKAKGEMVHKEDDIIQKTFMDMGGLVNQNELYPSPGNDGSLSHTNTRIVNMGHISDDPSEK